MGIIGPITSFVIGVMCLVLTIALGWTPPEFPQRPLPAMLMWLGYINIGLAIFNMIPGFPLDGGRVLRAIAWWITGNPKRATTIAARVGQVIAFGMIVYGLMQFFGGAGFNDTTVADVMRPLDQARTVGPNTPITEALELMASQDLNQLPIVADGALIGLISRTHVLQLLQTRAELHA